MIELESLVPRVCEIACEAGRAILTIYDQADIRVESKQDQSPLTEADMASHALIARELQALDPEIPLLSEESEPPDHSIRRDWLRYWLVDPLDGTKEFIRRNGEFTVNIALIENGIPVLGVVYAPVLDKLYWGFDGNAFTRKGSGTDQPISVVRDYRDGDTLRVVASRSHRSEELETWLSALPEHECVAMGSSLKLCLVAEGKAHLYPRIGPTMEWDTAAADAVVRAAGGCVMRLDNTPLEYNKEDLLNPYFLARCAAQLPTP